MGTPNLPITLKNGKLVLMATIPIAANNLIKW